MLNPQDRRAIEGLFERLQNVERTAEPRDGEAEALIQEKIDAQPSAPYYMAQTVLVQESALNLAEQRIRELEDKLNRRPETDFFGGLFGGGNRDRDRQRDSYAPAQRQPQPQQARGPWDNGPDDRRGGGGGFLAGAAQTALGVTSGVLLGSAIASMFGAGAAHAAEPQQPQDDNADDNGNDANDTGNDNDAGNDFDTGGGFDGGGDFGGGDFGGDF